jgi:hypothetical protein
VFVAGACAALALASVGSGCLEAGDAGERAVPVRVNDPAPSALRQTVDFAGGMVEDGDLPTTTADDVTVSDENGTYTLRPGEPPDILALGADHPPDDPVAATLLQFEGDDGHHIEVPADGNASDSDIAIEFSVGPDACDELCNEVYTLVLIEAVRLEGGDISARNRVVIELDCREHGNPARCPAGEPPPEEEALADAYVGAFEAYEQAVCACFGRGGLFAAEDGCDGFLGVDTACLGDVIESHAGEVDAATECERARLRELATCFAGATCADAALLPCDIAGAPMGGAGCDTISDAARAELDACLTPTE